MIVSAVTNLLANLIGVWFFRNYARINLGKSVIIQKQHLLFSCSMTLVVDMYVGKLALYWVLWFHNFLMWRKRKLKIACNFICMASNYLIELALINFSLKAANYDLLSQPNQLLCQDRFHKILHRNEGLFYLVLVLTVIKCVALEVLI